MSKTDDSTPKSGGSSKEVNRGTQDELQILGIIVGGNHSLRAAVMDKIRAAKLRRSKTDAATGRVNDQKPK